MDFEAIADYWFGEMKIPEFPLEPIDLGVGLSDEVIEFKDPFEGLMGPEEEPPIKETPSPEEEV